MLFNKIFLFEISNKKTFYRKMIKFSFSSLHFLFCMILKRRLDSTWNKIKVVDDNGEMVNAFELDRYGRLTTKFEKKTPRNIKLLLSNTIAKQSQTKPFVLPQISPPPLPMPILPQIQNKGQKLQMPQINYMPPEPLIKKEPVFKEEPAFKEEPLLNGDAQDNDYSDGFESSPIYFNSDDFQFDEFYESFDIFEAFTEDATF